MVMSYEMTSFPARLSVSKTNRVFLMAPVTQKQPVNCCNISSVESRHILQSYHISLKSNSFVVHASFYWSIARCTSTLVATPVLAKPGGSRRVDGK